MIEEPRDQVTSSTEKPQGQITSARSEFLRQFSVFSFLWAVASLQMVWNHAPVGISAWRPESLPSIVFVASGLAVIARRSSTLPFMVLVSLHFLHGAYLFPDTSDAQFVWFLANAAILSSYLRLARRYRRWNVDAAPLLTSFAPCARVLTLIFVGFTALSKFNWDFLRTASSSAALHYRLAAQAELGLGGGPWPQYFLISAIMVIESAVAISLLMPRFRLFGIGLGCLFFFVQSLAAFGEAQDSAPVAFALLFLFATPSLTKRLYRLRTRWPLLKVAVEPRIMALSGLVMAVITAVLYTSRSIPSGPACGDSMRFFSWAALGGIWLTLLLFCLADQDPQPTAWAALVMKSPLHYGLVGAALIAAASPYLGWRTRPAFTANSDLRTEGRGNNHLFVPQLYLGEYQTDLVKIHNSNDPDLQRIADSDRLLTWFELVDYTSQHPEVSLSFTRGRQTLTIHRAGDEAELSRANPWFLRKLLSFNPVPPSALADI